MTLGWFLQGTLNSTVSCPNLFHKSFLFPLLSATQPNHVLWVVRKMTPVEVSGSITKSVHFSFTLTVCIASSLHMNFGFLWVQMDFNARNHNIQRFFCVPRFWHMVSGRMGISVGASVQSVVVNECKGQTYWVSARQCTSVFSSGHRDVIEQLNLFMKTCTRSFPSFLG